MLRYCLLVPSMLFALLPRQASATDVAACPANLKWTAATYVQSTIRREGTVAVASIEIFSNATVSQLKFGNDLSRTITLTGPPLDQAITFTFGSERPSPQQFAELPMIAAPPWASIPWP